ncbi:hydantoinase B/oxoprolinase family protein [Conexibacter woesei]|uniref:Hydantoinase B/oxoprolinase n=1 Tax=Conexibacter woesei (strain DSM 14684 / CCUG 47730 / CIP 108061 / JCM 11494 / NBRC 100937 / ID131577) TaxID=469383 RepID=D3F590_CONWI|nr:hydantoinase B/oxoprolinase family protein [Conexibacter woesei]ADB50557.1 Hydantoinase B/oxoprolinase [Conexibacter woesei DSM 14684]
MSDPITAEIIRSYIDTSAEQLYETICRTSPNPQVNEGKDCGGGIYSYDGTTAKLVGRAGIIAHSFALTTSCQVGLDFFRGDLHPGDVLLIGDPYHGGSHCGCWTVVVPIFFGGRPRFLAAARLHVMDQGAPTPNLNYYCRDIWQEGLRLSPLKLYERGERRREVWDWITANNRVPIAVEGDIEAMLGACQIGERAMRELVDRHGLETVEDAVEWTFGYSERKFRDQLRRWPDGEYTADSYADGDWADHSDLRIQVAVTIDDDRMTVDFAGSDEQTDGLINSARPNTIAYVCIVLSALCPDIPVNAGFFEPLTIHLPEGTIVHPTAPTPTMTGTVTAGCQIASAVMKACEQFAPERVGSASIDITGPLVYGTDEREHRFQSISSRNPRFFMFVDISMVSMSSSAAYEQDGWGMWATPFSVASPVNVEFSEIQSPTLYRQTELSTDSAAPGQWRGTPALAIRRVDRGASDVKAMLLAQSLVHPLPGWVGGYEGAGNFIVVNEGEPDEMIAGELGIAHVAYDPAKTIFAQSGGGGGWGDPLDRDPAAVLDDVLDEYVSLDGAKSDYGVVVDAATRTVDAEATERERAARKREPGPRKRRGIGREWTIERAGIEARVDRVDRLRDAASAR